MFVFFFFFKQLGGNPTFSDNRIFGRSNPVSGRIVRQDLPAKYIVNSQPEEAC